ncbi:hypothetical protein BH10ACT7_BH10ACT7_31530 [soil metagenome]
MVLRLIAKIALGVIVGGVLGGIITGDDRYVAAWAIALPVFIFASVIGGVRSGAKLSGGGLMALARIETIQRTGLEANGSQECELRLVVAPEKSAAYTTTTRLQVATDDLRRFVPGTVLTVARRSLQSPDVTILPSPPAEWGALADAARRDPSRIPVASNAPEWTATATAPTRVRPQRWELVVSLLIILATAAVVLIPAYGLIGRIASNIAAGDWDGNNLVTGRYQQLAVDEVAAVAGSYQFTSINFYDDYVIVEGLTRPSAGTTDRYMYRYGRAFREGPSSIQPYDLGAELFDASELDFTRVADVVEDAVQRSGLNDIERKYAGVSRSAEGIEIWVYLTGPYESLNYTYDFDGNLLSEPER